MRQCRVRKHGLTLVELLVVLAIVGILAALLLPAIQFARESGRRTQCANHLRQFGIALQTYHDSLETFPSGYVRNSLDPTDGHAWGWGTFLLPYLEQANLYQQLDPSENSLNVILGTAQGIDRLRTRLPGFRCPSDNPPDLAHLNREFTGFNFSGPLVIVPGNGNPGSQLSWHPSQRGALGGVKTATANYVASFGDGWNPGSDVWTFAELQGNGGFGCNTRLRAGDIVDGTSHTLAIGERHYGNFAAVWAGVDWWDRCSTQGLQMVLGSEFYPLNGEPEPYPLTCDGRGAAGFSSRHFGGAQFALFDGSVKFLSSDIEFRNDAGTNLGTYQRLGRRNDGQPVGDLE